MARIEDMETTLPGLGPRWAGPTVLKGGTGTARIGQYRKAWYERGMLEEIICVAPGSDGEPRAECWQVPLADFPASR